MSTAVEVVGMACLAVAAFMFGEIPGLITAGLLLVLIGYSIEDAAVAVKFRRLVAPISARRQKRKQKRAEAK